MPLFGRGKQELYIGQGPSRLKGGIWRRRIRLALLVIVACVLFVWGISYDQVKSRRRRVQIEIEQIVTAARFFRQDYGRCPHDADELAHPPAGGAPYLARSPRDPWGQPYYLQCPSRWNENDVDVATRGPDGQWLGGDDMSTDL